ncbi:MAG: family 1 glycosylhydrolase [Verrucomicrobiota bacterium]
MSLFLWGVATSAYQSEGGYNGPGEPVTNWASAEAARDVMVAGRAAEFWNCYQEDFARCRQMGLNAFRLGIEWSRVQPGADPGRPAPAFDFEALDHYASMLVSCRQHGLEPVVTLHHFVHPAWLGPDPWLDPAVIEYFAAYVTVAVSYLNDALVKVHGMAPIRYYITVNEPNTLGISTYLANQFPTKARRGFSSLIRSLNQLLGAHIRAYNIVHDLYEQRGWEEPTVTLNNYCCDLYWADKALLDLLSLRERCIAKEEIAGHLASKAVEFREALAAAQIPFHRDLAYYFGSLVKRYCERSGDRLFQAALFAPLLDAIYASPRTRLFDCVAIDYYDPFVAHALRFPVLWDHEFKNKSIRSWIEASVISKWWDWRVLPRGLHFFCGYYSRDFNDRPVLIAENGMAQRRRPNNHHTSRRDGLTRSRFLALHIAEVLRIVSEGIPMIGYMHWSLFDNYEWGSFTPRFGLFSIDYACDTSRLVQDHLGDRPSEMYVALIREAREGGGRPGDGGTPVPPRSVGAAMKERSAGAGQSHQILVNSLLQR